MAGAVEQPINGADALLKLDDGRLLPNEPAIMAIDLSARINRPYRHNSVSAVVNTCSGDLPHDGERHRAVRIATSK